MNDDAFVPAPHSTVNVPAGISSASVAFKLTNPEPTPGVLRQVQIYNKSAVEAFVEFGDSTVVALVTDSMIVGPGACIGVGVYGLKYAAAIPPSGSGTVYFTPGRGI